ncbi:MAG: hypothetical protein JSU63_16600 [Phycisphaerales bacterium]|nr:MAG: hypothetical protein JSU63_16600 [Phycisphaerales bacterium]
MSYSQRHLTKLLTAIVIAVGLSASIAASSEVSSDNERARYEVRGGTVAFDLDADVLDALGIRFVPNGHIATADEEGAASVFSIEQPSTMQVVADAGGLAASAEGLLRTRGAFLASAIGARTVIGNLAIEARSSGVWTVWTTLDSRFAPEAVLDITSAMLNFEAAARKLLIIGDLSLTRSLAEMLGLPRKASAVVGTITAEVLLAPIDDAKVSTSSCLLDGEGKETVRSALADFGSDVIVADLYEIRRYIEEGSSTTAFAVGTNACNLGDARASWFADTNKHPLIAQNAYRLKDDRFEQIGMSWPKHGFYALSESLCEPCTDPVEEGQELGAHCSDPYSANLNGQQDNMSPRSTANPHTGLFPFPWPGWEDPNPTSPLERRLQVQNVDLDPELNEGARYFVQGHYIHPDDCATGSNNNNASYREVLATTVPDEGGFTLVIDDSYLTQRGQPAIRAWQDIDPLVSEHDIQVPRDGLFILAAKVTDLHTGFWRFEYALQNLNSDRAGGSFSVPIPDEAIVTNVGFHDVDYHSGEPYDPTDWNYVVTEDSITWSPAPFDPAEHANALRWGIVYNFHFDINAWSDPANITIGLFKPGTPAELVVETIGPTQSIIDCNANGIRDVCDLSCDAPECSEPCETSIDCDVNSIPDECQPDCNDNDVADPCDILQGTSLDCNSNAIPDDCETDCNQNTIPDDCDILATTSDDCNRNKIPDECDIDAGSIAPGGPYFCVEDCSEDCDDDGIPDECDTFYDDDSDLVWGCDDLCPTTNPGVKCAYGIVEDCCFPDPVIGWCYSHFNLPPIPPVQCIYQLQGNPYPPLSPLCRDGCLIGDSDDNGTLNLSDFAGMQNCFGCESAEADCSECMRILDFNETNEVIDLDDYKTFQDVYFNGPS